MAEQPCSVGPLAPGARLGSYEVVDWIGSGGTAAVYRARHMERGSLHALKVLLVDRPSLRQRLVTEGRVQAALRHPNLVWVTDAVAGPKGTSALVLEYIAGPSLDRILAARRLTIEEVDLLVRGILRGVAYAHVHGVVHRDLKPANILLAMHDGRVVPKVTDFGLVKLATPGAGGPRTLVGQTMGTPAYMPPEQFSDASSIDHRADVWALGVLIYELCTGTLPFDDDTLGGVVRQSSAADYVSPKTLVPTLPDRMAQAIEGALKADPNERIEDVATLLRVFSGDARAPGQRLPVKALPGRPTVVLDDFAASVAARVRPPPSLAPLPPPRPANDLLWGVAMGFAVGVLLAAAAVGTVIGAAVGTALQA